MEEKFKQRIKAVKGNYLHYYVDEVTLANGRVTTREIVKHPGAVAIVPLTPQGEIVLVQQYRYAIQDLLYELPAGKLEEGESPLDCAQRELAEETGYHAEEWEKLACFYTAPGFSSELIHLYLARNLIKIKAKPEPDEIITVKKITEQQILEMITTGKIKDGKTVLGILWLRQRSLN